MKYTHKNTSAIGRPKRVYLDGKEITHAIEADDEMGYVVSVILDGDGLMRVDAVSGEFMTEKISGEVLVVDMDV